VVVAAPRPALRRWRAAFLLAVSAALVLVLLLRPWHRRVREPEPVVTNSIGMKLALIPAGRFSMGSPAGDPGFGKEWEHDVVLTQSFYMGIYEVTQAEFQEVMGYNPSHFCPTGRGKDEVAGQDTRRFPVDSVRWQDAKTFCTKLSGREAEKQARREYRLPTEAEWEHACRAGSNTKYYFGTDAAELGRHAWFDENGESRTHAVGQKLPNAWGLYDMYGNVWEWCDDYFDESYYRNCPEKDPCCTRQSDRRVLRGGGWGQFGNPKWCRSAARGYSAPAAPVPYHGLRVVFTAPASTP
jgi:formylglycine-generating enzyme required for sulfatase activity